MPISSITKEKFPRVLVIRGRTLEVEKQKKELKTDENYESYLNLYQIYHGDNNYKKFDDKNKENKPLTSAQWASMVSIINKQILKYGIHASKLTQK